MHKRCFLALAFMALALLSQAQNTHFLTDDNYRQQVTNAFLNRHVPQQDEINGIQDPVKREALQFLYAYMPQSDLVDYDLDFTLQQVDIAFEARNTFSWGKRIPEDIFRHFVLVYRVNNEDLDTARAYIFHQLRERIKSMSMYDAALEVNHWCHEYVDYQPADVRTSAPLATIRTSHGRCGEESTLTVTALRAVGIPARQCYTPRWAHCDDNHAWVEAWVDGQWYFLGACEPDPELNMGWFAVPSTRTMMVHTNVFGLYNGPEEVNKKTPYYSCINVLPNYADTVTMTVNVVDEHNRPVPDATVRFKLYNYAEYYTLATRKTDDKGNASIITGKGDLLIWVNKGDVYNYDKMDGRTQKQLKIVLPSSGFALEPYTMNLDMYPPVGGANIKQTSAKKQALNEKRKDEENAKREAYRNSWPTKESLANYHNANFSDEQLYDIIHRSEGNYAEIMKFLDRHNSVEPRHLIPEYMAALADKDLRDVTADVLEEQLTEYHPERYSREVYVKGILPARISNELLRSNRNRLGSLMKSTFPTQPTIAQICDFIRDNITVDNNCNYYNCPISSTGVLKGRRADDHSLGIFFVALCRTFDVPAYMDNSNGELYAYESDEWHNVKLNGGSEPEAPQDGMATIVLHNPNGYTYYPHYTLQRFENGEFVSYDFENDPRVETDPIRLSIPAGDYCLSTGNRYSNGDVLSQMEFFTVKAKQTVEKEIRIRPLTARANNYGRIDVDQTKVNGQTLQNYMTQSGQSCMILCLVTPNTEPVNHMMKEICARHKDYEQWGGTVLFVNSADKWKNEKHQPKNIVVAKDNYNKIKKTILNGLVEKQQGENPICIVVDKNGTILFYSEGYHIGLGDLLIDAVNSK